MASLPTLRRVIEEVRMNSTDLGWWYRRVLVPYVVGTATRIVPWLPGYDGAISVMDEECAT